MFGYFEYLFYFKKLTKEEINKNSLQPVIVIDASNLIYRMYYTFINLSNSKGIMTGALYGFFDMIINYADKLQIKNIILVWDTPSEYNWRLEIYSDYKFRRRMIK